MFEDIKAVFERDPAAKNILEVLFYPGVWAIYIHRATHFLYKLGVPFIPRFISQLSRFLTGIEIHPGARIGKSFFIDHGMGVVIGETTVIGDHVTIYQGVTLGGTGKEKGKRHPTIGNNVIIGAEAIILGNINISDNSRVGAGAVVTKSVCPDCTIVGNPARVIVREGKKVGDLEHADLPDPVGNALEDLQKRIEALEKKLEGK
ncbi:MAG: serine O-acetyltransferase [Candidatus Saganbacteria bacterium]|nr:serine O-acetyltransferase [Candidatus Saganbacteria bacterium]